MVLLYGVIFTIIYPNVSIYTIHGSYGYCIMFYHVLSYSIMFYRVLSCSIMFYHVLSCCNCCNTCMFRHQNPFFARLSFRSTSSFRPSPLRSLSFPLYQKRFFPNSVPPRVVLAEQHQLSLLHGLDGFLSAALGHVEGPEDRSIEHHLTPATQKTDGQRWENHRLTCCTQTADIASWIIVIMLDQILNPIGSMVLLLY